MITDSAASLAGRLAGPGSVTVVPLRVLAGSAVADDGGDPLAGAEDLRRQLAAAIPADGPIGLAEAGTAILAHTGPGLLGVALAPVAP